MRKILIYPYSNEVKWILNREILFESFDSVAAILPANWKRESDIDQRIKKEDDFVGELKESLCLWIVSSELEICFEESILPKIKSAVDLGKKIFCTRNLKHNEMAILKDIVPENLWIEKNNNICFEKYEREIFDVDVPILYVLSLSEKLSSVEQLLIIQSTFADKGYNVAVFSDAKEVGVFENCYWLSMFCEQDNKKINQIDRIVSANHYIKHIEIEQNYDLFVIGIMGGTVILNRKVVEDFGVNTYNVSRAVKPDCVMLNIFYGEYEMGDLKDIVIETEGIIGCEIDYINIENVEINLDDTEYYHCICTIKVDSSLIKEKIEKLDNCKLYCLSYKNEVNRLIDSVIDKLGEYAEIIRM